MGSSVPLPLASMAREIGVVLSGASASLAPIAVRRDVELEVREEDLVVIVDRRLEDYYMLGVVRWVTRYEPFLRRGVHNVYVEHPEALDTDIVMPFTNAYAEIYAGICDGCRLYGGARCVEANVYAPTPGSRVFQVVNAEPLTEYLRVSNPIHVGRHKYTGWELPLDVSWINYHVGVFGATGTGKSRLVLRLVGEASKRGYSFIVFDHTGVDYVEYARRAGFPVVDARSIRIPVMVLAQAIAEMMGLTSNLAEYVEVAVACHDMLVRGEVASVDACLTGRRREHSQAVERPGRRWERSEFKRTLEEVARRLNARPSTIYKLLFYVDYYVPDEFFRSIEERVVEPIEVVKMALERRVVVVDLSNERDIDVKRAVVTSIVEAAWSMVHEMRQLNLGIVVDEAQNYACEYCGSSGKALETVAREGRKWGFFLVVASQRVVRDIRTGVRSNLGTVFFSRLQAPGDLQELQGYLDLGRVSEASLAMLSRREFYVAGLMNPLRRPILLKVAETHGFS